MPKLINAINDVVTEQLDKYKYSASCLSDKLAHMESILRGMTSDEG